MRAILLGIVAMLVISIVAAYGLGAIDMSSKSVYQIPTSVRL